MISFILGSFFEWFPLVLLVAGGVIFFFRDIPRGRWLRFSHIALFVKIAIGFKILFAIFFTIAQYLIWKGSAFTQTFLQSSLTETPLPIAKRIPWIFGTDSGYFIMYVWQRFWLPVFVSLLGALLFYLFLKFLRKHRERFFEDGEVLLGFFVALVVGWPNLIILIPSIFLAVIIVALVRLIVLRETYTTLGWPFVVASIVVYFSGYYFIELLRLGTLRV